MLGIDQGLHPSIGEKGRSAVFVGLIRLVEHRQNEHATLVGID